MTTLVLLAALAVAGCGNDIPTSPTTTTTGAGASISEAFAGTLAAGGFTFYSFTVSTNGTVNVTLTGVGGAVVPSTTWLGLGIGAPSGEDCVTTSAVNTQAGSTAQLTGTYSAGVYCARVWDIGNLAGPATFTATIAHP